MGPYKKRLFLINEEALVLTSVYSGKNGLALFPDAIFFSQERFDMANLWQQLENTMPNHKSISEDRLIMLCDGVFAIAITLLILDIRLPDDTSHFQENLLTFFLKILFYFVTFLIIAQYWILHRYIMHQVRRLDRPFLWLTLLFLAFVALVPATITVVSEFGNHYEADVIYGLSLAACGFSASALWIYASWKHRLIDPTLDQRFIHFSIISTLISPIYFLLSLLLLFILLFSNNPPLIFLSWIFIGIPSTIVRRIYSRQLEGVEDHREHAQVTGSGPARAGRTEGPRA